LSPPLRRVMFRPYGSRRQWRAAIFGEPLTTKLTWEDFEHLGPPRDLAADVLEKAVADKEKGINLLLYGPVGTGKTELCKALAAKSGLDIWSIGETDNEDGEPSRGERLASLKIAQHLLANRPNALILMDEAEDIFEQPGTHFGLSRGWRNGSKVHMNRLLESNRVP